jgi:hypothetical protein
METIRNWFQDWSDACEYANECAPDLSFLMPTEPFISLFAITAACFACWALTESRIRIFERARAASRVPKVNSSALKTLLVRMKSSFWTEKNLAA